MPQDWTELPDGPEKYSRYLCSREWSEKRTAGRRRARGFCERCKRHKMAAVHHLTYARIYDEQPDDLQAVCFKCHEFIHGRGVRQTSRHLLPDRHQAAKQALREWEANQ